MSRILPDQTMPDRVNTFGKYFSWAENILLNTQQHIDTILSQIIRNSLIFYAIDIKIYMIVDYAF